MIFSAILTVLSIQKILPYKIKIQLLNTSIEKDNNDNNNNSLVSSRRDVANNALKMLNKNIVHSPEEQCKVTVYVIIKDSSSLKGIKIRINSSHKIFYCLYS